MNDDSWNVRRRYASMVRANGHLQSIRWQPPAAIRTFVYCAAAIDSALSVIP